MTGIITYDTAGVGPSFWGFVDASSQRFLGAAKTLANGSDSAAVELTQGMFSNEINPAALRRVPTKGNNTFISEFIFPAEQATGGVITLGQFDASFDALPQDNKVYALDNHKKLTMIQPGIFNLRRLCLIFNSPANAQDSGSVGNPGWAVDIYPNIRLMSQGSSGMRSAQERSFTWMAVANRFDKLPWGQALTLSDHGTTNACGFRFFSPNPVVMHAFKGNAATATYTLSKTPAANDADSIGIWGNTGTKFVYTTDFTAAAKVVTLVATPGAVADITTLLEYDMTAA